jgi:hypothetical protein
VSSFDDIERRREANEGAHPRVVLHDEEGSFAVRAVFLDGVDRNQSLHGSLRAALEAADLYRAEMRGKGYGPGRLHVGVIDEYDPERGELDWDSV